MKLEQNLPHQINAINAVLRVFDNIEGRFSADRTKCPFMTSDLETIKHNIAQIQNGEKSGCFSDDYSVPETLRQNYMDSSEHYRISI